MEEVDAQVEPSPAGSITPEVLLLVVDVACDEVELWLTELTESTWLEVLLPVVHDG